MNITFGSTRPVMFAPQAKAQLAAARFGSDSPIKWGPGTKMTLHGDTYDQVDRTTHDNELVLYDGTFIDLKTLESKKLEYCAYYDDDSHGNSKLFFKYSDGTKFAFPPRNRNEFLDRKFNPEFLKEAMREALKATPQNLSDGGKLYEYSPNGKSHTILQATAKVIGSDIPAGVQQKLAGMLEEMGQAKFIQMIQGWGKQ